MEIINLGKVVGNDGKTAYEIWLEQGNSGTETDFLNSLKGKDGYTPVKGVDYFDGKDGEDYVLTEADKEDISKLVDVNIPTKVGQLENDKGYLTSVPSDYKTKTENDELYQEKGNYLKEETDPTVPSHVKNITANDISNWNNKSEFSGIYNDLSNKPTKVSAFENDKGYLSSIPLEYVTETELSEKEYATESFVTNKIAEAELSGGEVDLSGLATKDELNAKVDKVKGKSLIDDTEITRLASVTNYDDTEIKNQLNSKANKTDIPTVPTNISAFTNDKGYLTSIPSEYVTETELNNKKYLTSVPSDYKTKTENDSLYQAKGNYLTSIPSEYVTETELNNKGYLTEHQDLSSYAKTTDIPTKVSELANDKNYITSIPSEYVTETELNNKKYLTSIPSEYITETELNTAISGKANTSDIPTKVGQLTNDKGYITGYTETDPTVPAWAKATTKPSYTKSEVGLANVDNVKQYSASNPPPYPVTSVNGKTGAVTVEVSEEEKQEIIDEVVSSMSYVEPKTIPYTVTKSCVQSATGKIGSTSDHMRTDYIPLTGYDTIKYIGKCATSKLAIGFFDDAQQPMLSEGVVGHGTSKKEVIKTIPQGAAYAVCSVYVGSDTSTELVVDVYYSKSNPTAEAIKNLKSSIYSFEGKKVMFFGDSITYDANMYRKYLLETTKMVEVACFALNGATMKNHSDTVMDGNPVALQHSNTIPNQVQKLLNNSTSYDTPDIVIISAATNDGSAEENYDETQYTDGNGTFISLDNVNLKTFSGSMRWAYEKIISLYPNTKIFFATPIQCGDGSTRTFASLKVKAECIRQNCERLSTPCIDAFRKSGIYGRYDAPNTNGKYLKDGLHPNANGAKVLSKCYHRELANALID